jgi:RNA polymerase sigma-70 factor (ECF subfamily)
VKVHNRLAKLKELFASQHKHLFIAALSITRNRASAEDCVHDALLAVAEIETELDDIEAYLFRVVRNKAIHRAGHSARYENEVEDQDFIASESITPESKAFMDQVKQHISFLDMNYQQVLIMKLFTDLTFIEIAKITEHSPNTVASWYRRGLTQLKERINEIPQCEHH